ncbi:hypothetical protein E3G52_000301 [Mycobacteroides abscessus]|uniref:hypothetical protein n=1 Tax=Mycobacteroides abscessus TaxID=36809 RepID=UPI001C6C08E2|nr:hypothetical protein [Mycobacteroides abscessus]MBE5453437.1 hypothetical protein [Mycobacteroides abscessus]
MTEPNNNRWLRKWLRFQPHQTIGSDPNNPYLLRWYVIPRNRWLNIYLHKFLRDDDDRALHDHPWWFVSLMLWGQYVEVTEEGRVVRSAPEPWRWFWGDRPLAFRASTWRHRVELIKEPAIATERTHVRPRSRAIPAWTLIVTGRRTRLWGFWCKDRADEVNVDNAIDRMRVRRGEVFDVDRFIRWDEFGDAGCGEPTVVSETKRPILATAVNPAVRPSAARVLQLIVYELHAQQEKWGDQNHPNVDPILTQREGGCTVERMADEYGIPSAGRARYLCQQAAQQGASTWGHILVEELAEAIEAATLVDQANDLPDDVRGALRYCLHRELIQVAAVAVNWAEKVGGADR